MDPNTKNRGNRRVDFPPLPDNVQSVVITGDNQAWSEIGGFDVLTKKVSDWVKEHANEYNLIRAIFNVAPGTIPNPDRGPETVPNPNYDPNIPGSLENLPNRNRGPEFLNKTMRSATVFYTCKENCECFDLDVDTSDIEFDEDGGSDEFMITAAGTWRIVPSDTWIVVTPASGTGSDDPIEIGVSVGRSTTDREGTITVISGPNREVINVTQVV